MSPISYVSMFLENWLPKSYFWCLSKYNMIIKPVAISLISLLLLAGCISYILPVYLRCVFVLSIKCDCL
jgi:hypothetical protein